MNYFTTRNTVILGLVQVGIIVLGVLAAGTVCKWHTTFNMTRPLAATIYFADYGFLVLALPLAWVTMALLMQRQKANTEEANSLLAFSSGIVVLLLVTLLVCHGKQKHENKFLRRLKAKVLEAL